MEIHRLVKFMARRKGTRKLYVQVTVHRDNLRINNQQDTSSVQNFYFVTKLHIFRASSVPIIRIYQLYTWKLVCFMQVMWPLIRKVRLEQPDSPRQPVLRTVRSNAPSFNFLHLVFSLTSSGHSLHLLPRPRMKLPK